MVKGELTVCHFRETSGIETVCMDEGQYAGYPESVQDLLVRMSISDLVIELQSELTPRRRKNSTQFRTARR